MNLKARIAFAIAAPLAAAALTASAQTLYKLIDKNGKVTYSEEKPKNFDGQVIQLDINPNANTATLPKAQGSPSSTSKGEESRARPRESARQKARNDAEARVSAAREKLEAARKALQDAKDNPGEDDVQLIGKKGGGARPVPTDAYVEKLAKLEQAVTAAEEELKRAEKEL